MLPQLQMRYTVDMKLYEGRACSARRNGTDEETNAWITSSEHFITDAHIRLSLHKSILTPPPPPPPLYCGISRSYQLAR